MDTIYKFQVVDLNGEMVCLSEYSDHVMLIVNTASKCGFTPQFRELQDLYDKYKDSGFVVLGFPCDQFLNQEFNTNEEIVEFCQINYHVDFPMFAKVEVKGKNIHPLFQYLTHEKRGLFHSIIKWNFTKFLIDRKGKVVKRYAPNTRPMKIEGDIQKLLS
ncbi:glutathione peroxidase [Oikeobacillus pervagus]|uniref:Glutathione peroxidase n=1 Tax=Oikeobacillus pervagus TaxID=1325931 RepID=A0AAJ1T4L3_9BACI|nr:glutathione peroxidase [Oikeobacillus pervagus]MDQ0216521.1 glutathione peroxidase [Oikeobacillus pervagus]